jgi:Tetratricopeptide repeat
MPRRWALVLRQFLLANVIVGCLAATGWLVAFLAQLADAPAMSILGHPVTPSRYAQVIGWNTAFLTFTVLITVVLAIEVLRFVVRTTARVQRVAALAVVVWGLAGSSAGQSRHVRVDGLDDTAVARSEQFAANEPGEVETWRQLGVAHQRAGRWRKASAAYRRALDLAPDDKTLIRQLESVRLRVAPAFEVGATSAVETGASAFSTSVAADLAVGDSGRIGLFYLPRLVSSDGDAVSTQRAGARVSARPRPDIHLNASGALWSPTSTGFGTDVRPELSFRFRKNNVGKGPAVDVRAHHQTMDVTPDLVRTPGTSTQVSGRIDVPVGGLVRVRGQGRLAALSRDNDATRRTGIGGGLAVAVLDDVRVSGQWHLTRHSNPFVIGYFAPRQAQTVEMGIELEREFDRGTISLDVGGGIQRVQKTNIPIARWAPALRGWGLVTWALTPRQQLLLEFESHDSQIGNTILAAERWRYLSTTASLRIVFPH